MRKKISRLFWKIRTGGVVDKVIERFKTEFKTDDARYAYADSVANAFITGQINALREARDLTQEQLAELVGTRQSGISRWQNSGYSSCKVETLRKFAKAFGVRLRLSFEEFGSLPDDIGGFTKERLAPRRFEDDPVFAPAGQVDTSLRIGALMAAANTNSGETPTLDDRHGAHGRGRVSNGNDSMPSSSSDQSNILSNFLREDVAA